MRCLARKRDTPAGLGPRPETLLAQLRADNSQAARATAELIAGSPFAETGLTRDHGGDSAVWAETTRFRGALGLAPCRAFI